MSDGDEKGGKTAASSISSVAEFLAYAHAIEIEAEERYEMLADQMEVHHNREVAALFRKLAVIEGLHAKEIKQRAAGMELPHIAPWDYRWPGAEAPETADFSDAHYLMTPYHVLKMALRGEQGALRFFETLARDGVSKEIRDLAEEFVADEREHVRMVEDLLTKYPEPEEGWEEDPDPPAIQE